MNSRFIVLITKFPKSNTSYHKLIEYQTSLTNTANKLPGYVN